jgi:hypothetical protein
MVTSIEWPGMVVSTKNTTSRRVLLKKKRGNKLKLNIDFLNGKNNIKLKKQLMKKRGMN